MLDDGSGLRVAEAFVVVVCRMPKRKGILYQLTKVLPDLFTRRGKRAKNKRK